MVVLYNLQSKCFLKAHLTVTMEIMAGAMEGVNQKIQLII